MYTTYTTKFNLILILFLIPLSVLSQKYYSAVDVLGGVSQEGYSGLINYNHYISRESSIQGGVYVSFSEKELYGIDIPYNNLTFNLGFVTTLLDNKFKTFSLNIGSGIIAGYEIINNGDKELVNGALILNDSGFIYGGFATLELEKIIGDGDWNLLLKSNYFYHHNSDLGKHVSFVGLGFRIYIL